jgi:hypothetical protein
LLSDVEALIDRHITGDSLYYRTILNRSAQPFRKNAFVFEAT